MEKGLNNSKYAPANLLIQKVSEGKLGVKTGTTVIDNVVGNAETHCPIVGVKVYIVVPNAAVLTALFHVPVIAGILSDEVGKMGGVSP
jgi:hypothetical protein